MNSTARFNAKVIDGMIIIPEEHREKFVGDIDVILLKTETNEGGSKSLFGSLSHLANPDLWELEDGAMGRALAENYAAEKHQYQIDRYEHNSEVSVK